MSDTDSFSRRPRRTRPREPRVGLRHGQARRGNPPRHAPPPGSAGARPRLPPARGGRLDNRRHRARPPDAGERWAASSRGSRSRAADRGDALPPRPRRRRSGPGRAHRRAGLQGRLDYEQCDLVWGHDDWADALVDWFRSHGVPDDVMLELIEQGALYRPFIRYQRDWLARARRPGRRLAHGRRARARGWAADAPARRRPRRRRPAARPDRRPFGLWPRDRLDPLGDYLGALEETIALDARLPLGPRRPDRGSRRTGAEALIEGTIGSAWPRPRPPSATTTQRIRGLPASLFEDDLKPSARRFAVAETLSHLERLVLEEARPATRASAALPILRPEWTASYRPVPAPLEEGRPPSPLETRDERRLACHRRPRPRAGQRGLRRRRVRARHRAPHAPRGARGAQEARCEDSAADDGRAVQLHLDRPGGDHGPPASPWVSSASRSSPSTSTSCRGASRS